ncbi:hypothetical protein P3X46_018728 [Hevea brasiliensis]|uniref:Transmembrane protein n=1 Tax=Hevea brasiliensis TaxID=3981 RepID=A0ABQ9LVQ8_HEVBR|nr:PAMP-induced secreted peptide 2 [Hevea brasiliensis]KAJ9170634.1 hypothetical protein P3X46_018728 [Hevea brasiliensis]
MADFLRKSLSFFLILVLINLVFLETEAGRPLKTRDSTASRVIKGFLDGFSLGAIKESGPSPGVGHKYANTKTLGGIKDSGPSPGEGHKAVNGNHL